MERIEINEEEFVAWQLARSLVASWRIEGEHLNFDEVYQSALSMLRERRGRNDGQEQGAE